MIDPRRLRACLGHFATGVTVVACEVDGTPHGATVSAFTSVSLQPPLVLVSLARTSKVAGYLTNRPFTVNVLAEDQSGLARRFAGQPSESVARWTKGPRLAGAVVTVDCSPWDTHDGGDHVLVLGKIEELDHRGGAPLLFHGGTFRRLGATVQEPSWPLC
jgi:flavin reductase (DIM6/NTAB) family NADH-FMN oxidoreductase RutF